MSAVQRFCDRALLLERGNVAGIGDPADVAEQYLALNFADRGRGAVEVEQTARSASADAVLREVWFEDEFGLAQEFIPQSRRCTFKARVQFQSDVEAAGFRLSMENDSGQQVFATRLPDDARRQFRAGETAVFAIGFANDLDPGWRYYVNVMLDGGRDGRVIERRDRVASMVVTGARHSAEPVELDHDFTIEDDTATVT
jgi:hypothetical protein